MTPSYRAILALTALFSLAGCAAQNPEVSTLTTEVNQLNQKLDRLTDLAGALEHQTTLNRQSTNGVYLLPQAKTPALLNTDFAQLSLSLDSIAQDSTGTSAVLKIKSTSGKALPAFSAVVDWGQIDQVTGKPLTVDMQSQVITVTPRLLPSSEQTTEVRFSNITPETLGFVHLHHLTLIPEGNAGAKP
jgi:outer membrane murein-binding lipoprotein Lpp